MSTTESLPTDHSLFSITDKAALKLLEILSSEASPSMRLRVAVRPGGCSGFSYEMYFDDETSESDVRFDHAVESRSVPVVVDTASAGLIRGATLDYTDGLSGSGFKFSNPNATRTCGCGQSFS
jgi:iron-sulfur cluster insertion protein